MKNFNITRQEKTMSIQTWFKEYINPLKTQVNSLYEYLHYYNPEWRMLGEPYQDTERYYSTANGVVTESDIITATTVNNTTHYHADITKLYFRWGIKNRTTEKIAYGNSTYSNSEQFLNIGASLYKIDAVDVNYSQGDILSHFLVFEAALAQYITWTISTGVTSGGHSCLIYTYHLSNELDFGLAYTVQAGTNVPRYFYYNNGVTDYPIKYLDDGFDSTGLFDYTNVNIRVQDGDTFVPSSFSSTVYQQWGGATSLFPQTVYKDNNQYEDLIADTVVFERPGKKNQYQVRMSKKRDAATTIEDKFEVVFS